MEKKTLWEQYCYTTTNPSKNGFMKWLQGVVGSQKKILEAWDAKIKELEEEIRVLKNNI